MLFFTSRLFFSAVYLRFCSFLLFCSFRLLRIVLTHLIIIIFHVRARDALTRSLLSVSISMSFFYYHTPLLKIVMCYVCAYVCLRMWVNVSIRENTSNKNFSHLFVLFIWFVFSHSAIPTVWLDGRLVGGCHGCCCCFWQFLMMILYISFSIESKFVHVAQTVQIYTNVPHTPALALTLKFSHRKKKRTKTSKCSSNNH